MVDATRTPDDPTPVGDLIGEALAASLPWQMTEPCPECGSHQGYIVPKGHQDTGWCADCDTFIKNVGRTESGRARRTVKTLHGGPPSQHARIIERASGRCELCGQRGILHIGHILSVADGLIAIEDGQLTEREFRSDDNLILLCEACNSGFGRRSLPVRLFVALLRARLVEPRRGRAG